MRKTNSKFLFCLPALLLAVICLTPARSAAQVRAGSAYLKITPGTRQQSLAGSLTGALDDSYLLYSNPGAVGLLREWQWSASYTEWIADIFNLSLLYGRQLRVNTPWSNRINLALGLNYQGVRNFDATRGAQPSASANDLLLNASLGIPIGFVDRNLSFGFNLKYLRSELDRHSDGSVMLDIGAIYRTPRFRLSERGFFQHGILSAGISYSHLGSSLKFIDTKTPLPRTFRTGLALNLGRHDGLQLQLSADYQDVRDEENRFGFGVQFTNLFSRLVAVRGGYNQLDNRNTELLSKYAVGLSIKLDDYMNPQARATARSAWLSSYKNSDMRVDLGFLDGQKVGKVYQGSFTTRTNRPEHFGFVSPMEQEFSRLDTVSLSWQATRDPELYDDVDYLLLMTRNDSLGLAQLIEKSADYAIDLLALRRSGHSELKSEQQTVDFLNVELYAADVDTNLQLLDVDPQVKAFRRNEGFAVLAGKKRVVDYVIPNGLEHGHYYWTVMAYDRNFHGRFVETNGRNIAELDVIAPPNLTIRIQKEVVEPQSFNPEKVYFAFASDELDSLSQAKLNVWVDFLKAYPDTFTITGHADIQADRRLDSAARHRVNLEWSRRRAQKVFDYLVAHGIDSTRLKLSWLGEAAPVDTNQTNEAFGRNRRVELTPPQDFQPPAPQLVANVVVTNHFAEARNFSLTVSDADESQPQLEGGAITSRVPIFVPSPTDPNRNVFTERVRDSVQVLQPGQSYSVQIPWDELKPTLLAQVDEEDRVKEVQNDELDGEADNWDIGKIVYDLSIENQVDRLIVQSGDTVHYQVTVTNHGEDLAKDITVNHYPAGDVRVIFAEAATVSAGKDTLSWQIPFLRKDESRSFLVEAVVGDLDFDSTAVVIASRSELFARNDADPGNNNDKTTIYAALIKFEFNKCVLTRESQRVLSDIAQVLQNGPQGQSYEIAGFADTTGSSRITRAARQQYNRELSCLRAKAAKEFLVAQGVSVRLVAVGKGESDRYPTYEKNRRVEIRPIADHEQVQECSCSRSLRHCPCES